MQGFITNRDGALGLQRLSSDYNHRAKELGQHIANLKELLFSINKD